MGVGTLGTRGASWERARECDTVTGWGEGWLPSHMCSTIFSHFSRLARSEGKKKRVGVPCGMFGRVLVPVQSTYFRQYHMKEKGPRWRGGRL